MKNYIVVFTLSCLLISSAGTCQTIHVGLDNLTTLDEILIHITLLKSKPKVELKIPDIDTTNSKFFDLFYTWDEKSDPSIDGMVIPKEKVDEIYLDTNNDEDLTNDGSPYIFDHTENKITVDIISKNDKNQITKLVLQRKPELPDSLVGFYVDGDGNLSEKVAKMYGMMKGDFNYKGKKGTFYFDDRATLRRGMLEINNTRISIGLFDYTNNGLFNDDKDLVIIDLNGDKKLEYENAPEVFKLTDVFTIQSQNYKIQQLDKYGKWLDLVKTDEEATFYFLKEQQQIDGEQAVRMAARGEIDASFWKIQLSTIKNEMIDMKSFKGKFLLINFWGEWCIPCLAEIPDIQEINEKFADTVRVISFLKTNDLEKAKKVIKEKKINWAQIPLSDVIGSHFKVNRYPTNILIFPDGKQYIQTGVVNINFIGNYVNQK